MAGYLAMRIMQGKLDYVTVTTMYPQFKNDIDNKDNIQLIIAVWKIPFEMLKSKFRKQKHFVYDINWFVS